MRLGVRRVCGGVRQSVTNEAIQPLEGGDEPLIFRCCSFKIGLPSTADCRPGLRNGVEMTQSALADAVGPCFSRSSLAEELGWTDDDIVSAAQDLTILELTASEGVSVFPAFQVRERRLPPGLGDVLAVLATGSPRPWTWALWLNNPTADPRIPGVSHRAIDRLFNGELARVLRDAARTAQAWKA